MILSDSFLIIDLDPKTLVSGGKVGNSPVGSSTNAPLNCLSKISATDFIKVERSVLRNSGHKVGIHPSLSDCNNISIGMDY